MEGDKEPKENKETFQEKINLSEQAFIKQFDPSSPEYHGGLQVPVPLHGERVPDSMPTIYPEGYNPNEQPEAVDYGEEYKKVEQNRAVYQNIKKSLAKLGPIVQSFLRHAEAFKLKGDPQNQKHIKTHQENIQKETIALKAVQAELSAYVPQLQSMDEQGKQTAKELTEVIHQSGKKYQNKESLTQFNFKSKRLSAKTFASAQKCLQRLKDIKKQHLAAKKAAQVPKQQPTA